MGLSNLEKITENIYIDIIEIFLTELGYIFVGYGQWYLIFRHTIYNLLYIKSIGNIFYIDTSSYFVVQMAKMSTIFRLALYVYLFVYQLHNSREIGRASCRERV